MSDGRLAFMESDSPLTQDAINATAWRACDTFRGTLDPSEYKNYILTMLFLKYLSDLWKDRQAAYGKKYAGDEERVTGRWPANGSSCRRRATSTSSTPSGRRQPRRADQRRPREHRGREQGEARERLPQHRLQLRAGARPDQGPEPPAQEPA